MTQDEEAAMRAHIARCARSVGQYEDKVSAYEKQYEGIVGVHGGDGTAKPSVPLAIRDRDYNSLSNVLAEAYNQAASGKGKERHAKGQPFEKQRMQGISALLETDRGMAFQAMKKLTEGLDLEHDARERELLGAINYIAGIIVYHREQNK